MRRCFIHAIEFVLLPFDVALVVLVLVAGEIAAHRANRGRS